MKKSELRMGIKAEGSEHSGTYRKVKSYFKKHGKFPTPKQYFKMIASDHILKEDPRYYTKLRRAGL